MEQLRHKRFIEQLGLCSCHVEVKQEIVFGGFGELGYGMINALSLGFSIPCWPDACSWKKAEYNSGNVIQDNSRMNIRREQSINTS